MFNSTKKIVSILVFSSILMTIGTICYWWYGVQHITTQLGRLNINKISEDNRLKIVQQDIDFLIDIAYPGGGYYTAIIPFTVQAGFELDKIEIIEEPNINAEKGRISGDNKTEKASTLKPGRVKINLPEPKILNSDITDDQKYVILRDSKSGEYFDLTKAYESFGKSFVEQTAIDNRILSEANREAAKVLTDLAKNVYPKNTKIEINTLEPTTGVKKMVYKCGTMPIYFSLFEKDTLGWKFLENSAETVNMGYYGFQGILDNGSVVIKLTRAGKAKDLKTYMESWAPNAYARFFSPLDPDLRVYLYYEGSTKLGCYYLFNGFLYELSIKGADKDTLNRNLERVFPIILNLRLDNAFPAQDICNYDDYGLIKPMWKNWSIDTKRDYFNYLFLQFSKFNKCSLRTKGHSSGISIVYDEKENENEKDIFENIVHAIKLIVEKGSSLHGYLSDKDFMNDCIGAIYNDNRIHRNRYVFFMSDKVIFFTSNRELGLKAVAIHPLTYFARNTDVQDSILTVVSYDKFNTNSGGTLSIKDKNVVFAKDFVGDKEIRSENLSKFIIWLVSNDNRTFIDLFKCQNAPNT